jgi:hypothetical protein
MMEVEVMNRMYSNLRCGGFALVILMALAVVSQAAIYDLTTAGSSEVINGAKFMTFDIAPTGTGNIDSFVRIQKNGVEQGYNTDASSFAYDEKAGVFTHSLLLGDVPTVQLTAGGPLFYEFGLDINQTKGGALLSLDSVMIFRETVGDLSVPVDNLDDPPGALVYDMDAGGDNWVKLNYDLGAGSGQGDMYLYVPTTMFSTGTGNYVYLYSKFGVQTGYEGNDGFEEWFVRENLTPPPPPVPVPAAALLGLLGLGAASMKLRRFA